MAFLPTQRAHAAAGLFTPVKTLSTYYMHTVQKELWLPGVGVKGRLTAKGHKDTFWKDKNVVYLGWGVCCTSARLSSHPPVRLKCGNSIVGIKS